jgi:hypothetical protein
MDVISNLELMIANEIHPRKKAEMRTVLADTLKKIESKLK